MVDFKLNDVLELKKKHTCGSYRWQVIRYGADCKLKCIQCGRVIMVDRVKLKKMIKKNITREELID